MEVPPILDEDTWERLQDALDALATKPGRFETRLASNIALCGVCSTAIVGTNEANGRRTYGCRKTATRPNACGGISATTHLVDDVIAEKVSDFLNDRARVAKLLRQHAKGAELEHLHIRQEELNENLIALDSALNPPPGKPRLPLDRYWRQVELIEAERAVLQRKLAVTREAALLAETMNVDWTPEVWTEQPLAWRRAILKLVTLRIALHKPTVRTHPGVNGAVFDPERVQVTFAV